VERDIDLIAQDHDVQVVHLSAAGPQRPSARAWPVETISMTPANPLSVRAAASPLRELVAQCDLLHTMAASALLPFRRITPAVPWVHTEHLSGILAPETLPPLVRLALPSTLRLLARPDVVVAVGERLADAIRRRRKGEVMVIPNAVEHADTPVERRPLVDGRLSLVAVGGVIPRKGPETAVRVVAELVHRGWDVSLRWVGEGPQLAHVEALAADLGVRDRVEFVGSFPSDGVLRELARADVFLLPTTAETFGVSIAEALAAGRPAVVGGNGGQAEFVEEPDGVLVDDRDPATYADAVERVLELNEGRSAAEIAERVRRRFTEESRRALYRRAYADAGIRHHGADA